MKTLLQTTILVLWLIFPVMALAVESDDILGEWVTEGGSSRVEIFKKDHHYFGKIVALKNPDYLPGEAEGEEGTPRLDLHNPDETLRSRPLVGVELVQDFRFDKEMWVDGRIYDPENGKDYSCKISLSEDGKLHVRGFVGVSLLGRTTVWEPAEAYLEKELAFLGLSDCLCQ
jgi:uncharacterized protein (DUF2147 family)